MVTLLFFMVPLVIFYGYSLFFMVTLDLLFFMVTLLLFMVTPYFWWCPLSFLWYPLISYGYLCLLFVMVTPDFSGTPWFVMVTLAWSSATSSWSSSTSSSSSSSQYSFAMFHICYTFPYVSSIRFHSIPYISIHFHACQRISMHVHTVP